VCGHRQRNDDVDLVRLFIFADAPAPAAFDRNVFIALKAAAAASNTGALANGRPLIPPLK
jgi:hypothetical protein